MPGFLFNSWRGGGPALGPGRFVILRRWGDRLLALWEAGQPHELDSADLATLGATRWVAVPWASLWYGRVSHSVPRASFWFSSRPSKVPRLRACEVHGRCFQGESLTPVLCSARCFCPVLLPSLDGLATLGAGGRGQPVDTGRCVPGATVSVQRWPTRVCPVYGLVQSSASSAPENPPQPTAGLLPALVLARPTLELSTPAFPSSLPLPSGRCGTALLPTVCWAWAARRTRPTLTWTQPGGDSWAGPGQTWPRPTRRASRWAMGTVPARTSGKENCTAASAAPTPPLTYFFRLNPLLTFNVKHRKK